ncbi:MAG: hypothetical protein H6878_11280 [Rhodobiaceae bacterium]|nr:hypothetical protein [Rhodobiaceae bacterium]MCC0016841.1 hypothetical protein [Rhodobiaceae bacterium]MCC0041463.1 hypothetical protein [Rhodobiaceae bacterium]
MNSRLVETADAREEAPEAASRRPTPAQLAWLECGRNQPGGKLPLFDGQGQRVARQTIRACIAHGWAEPWVANPIKPDWEVCRLTQAGRALLKP